MPHTFSDKLDRDRETNFQSLPFGVSKVRFTGAMMDTTEAGKVYIHIGLIDAEGVEDNVRLWFTSEASEQISYETIRDILVHCTPEEKKPAVRAKVRAAQGAEDLEELMNEYLMNNNTFFWFTKYYDLKRTYTAQDGSTRHSVNKNIMAYQPKEKPELMTDPLAEESNNSFKEVEAVFPGAKEVPNTTAENNENLNWLKN